ncbi:PREDICTED: muscle LIM protein 1-like [Priapulus caudatus]|uniref:Muscle LIM protein 1-like n=1 Tax=Priapulus caudatus TaxID=37621 RepID=A0ABM1F2F7_PRICU|nr:PREDICTED: muscle LIM protein 1-like [Priapulus caudatus]
MSNRPTTAPHETSFIPPGADRCGRCGKAVYAAEKRVGGGGIWHKTCFNCATCHKMLESGVECAADNEVFCKTCYGRKYGPKGVGFGGGAGCLSAE